MIVESSVLGKAETPIRILVLAYIYNLHIYISTNTRVTLVIILVNDSFQSLFLPQWREQNIFLYLIFFYRFSDLKIAFLTVTEDKKKLFARNIFFTRFTFQITPFNYNPIRG